MTRRDRRTPVAPRRALAAALACGLGGAFALTPGPASAQRQHTVRPGQSLALIARRNRVDPWDLALASGVRPDAVLRPGQTLTIPSPRTTFVRPGQTLSEIAEAHGCTVESLRALNRLRPGAVLRVGHQLLLPGYEPDEATPPPDWGDPAVPGTATLRRHDEVRTVALVDAERRVTREGVEALAWLMRRHDDDPPALPHPRLALLLAAISDHFGGREITIVSGRREAGGYTRETSRHTEGRATDIRVRGVPMRAVWDHCRSLAATGCGFYPRSTFVHVDVRGRAAQWVDWSGPGQRARYGTLERPYPRMCRRPERRAHRLCRREGRHVTDADAVPVDVVLTEAALALYPVVEPAPSPGDDEEVDEYETAADDDEVAPDGEPAPGSETAAAAGPRTAVAAR